jgi:hypothetical protein
LVAVRHPPAPFPSGADIPIPPALEFGHFRDPHENGFFFHPTFDSAPHGAGKYVKKREVYGRKTPANFPFFDRNSKKER